MLFCIQRFINIKEKRRAKSEGFFYAYIWRDEKLMFYITCILYILTPLSFTLLWRRFKWRYLWMTYLLTAIVIYFLPSIMQNIDYFFNPPLKVEGKCGMTMLVFYFANTFILI